MELCDYYLKYMNALCEGTLAAPEGIALSGETPEERAMSLQAALKNISVPDFVRRCARAAGDALPDGLLDRFNEEDFARALFARMALGGAPQAEEPPAPAEEADEPAPDPDAGKHAFEVFCDCLMLDENLIAYLIDVLKANDRTGFYKLSQITTHLDLDGRRLLQDALQKYAGTILLVSHDVEFVRAVATSILEITREGIRQYPGGYDYYCEKKAEREKTAQSGWVLPGRAPSRPIGAGEAARTLSQKELRQKKAAAREKFAPRLRELKKRVEAEEKKVDELQKALDEASAELFNPTPTTDFAEANRKVRTLQFEIDRHTADWEEAATALEALQKESDAAVEAVSL